ncbi:DNA repair protein RadA [Clostridium novyi B str. ATCC 27606]|uniref:DNA repair protein RadA n=2 Tax=Clostridium TaxID=1485 RepID=A0AA40M6J5_CLONO|nr:MULTISPECIES: DNA repair protein RadA [Clostridium]KEI12307.1 DNA repair protein RadA [Clostridium novyi B str. NCTC 9691]KEI15860.1 DNA repair protein RadA [Clostridium haemolyticum NCTC 9693]KEI18393.1 DNA repair protein RadA [Clostridium novyi B str. ATCC 27606]KGN00857.1 DNA repair protein RadA [Clostridium haemolyticum NCTC 8350]OOB75957.1 DNA repair protein RadA [Clostridium haemolyticum]
MAKSKNVFICQECGYEAPKWFGKCPSCATWNSMVEEKKMDTIKSKRVGITQNNSKPESILNIKSGEFNRYDTGIVELNRVLGGGLVKGSLTLISGSPGIGKSTILLQTANNIASKVGKVLYVSGEESGEQIKIRGDRIGNISPELYILSETNLELIEEHINYMEPVFIIIDSIQTLFKPSVESAPGSVSQVRECSNELMRIAKTKNIPLFIVAHVTKQGELAGPRVLEHMVDTVLSFEGERTQEFRILRTLKNRFGTTSEIGVFEMREEGLKEIFNPSEVFLEETNFNLEGSIVIGIMEGTRPILVEIQALVTETKAIMPRRTAVGVDNSRLNLILAVLEKKLKIPFYNCDVYVNVVGGIDIEGTYGDLGLALALISSIKGRNFKLDKMIVFGEIGLTGEVRPISLCDRLVNEGIKMGFENIVIPTRNKEKIITKNKNVIGVSSLKEAVSKVF